MEFEIQPKINEVISNIHSRKFINLTNHSSHKWDENQMREAEKYGEIMDMKFPEVDPKLSEEELVLLAQEYNKKILNMSPSAVLCQGEYSFTFALTNMLLVNNITVLAACSERTTIETVDSEGMTNRQSQYKFIKFRKY